MRLKAFLRRYLGLTDTDIAPLAARVSALEERIAELDAVATDREIRWAEMNAQLRRYLGRLDAHAARSSSSSANGHELRGGPRPDVIAAKYPGGLPTKE